MSEMVELIRHLIVVRSAVVQLLSAGKSLRLPPTVSPERYVSALWGRISQTKRPYVEILCLGTLCLGINPIVFVPVGIRVPTLLTRRPSSLAKEVLQIAAWLVFIRCMYSSDAPVSGSRTVLMDASDSTAPLMDAAIAYLDR